MADYVFLWLPLYLWIPLVVLILAVPVWLLSFGRECVGGQKRRAQSRDDLERDPARSSDAVYCQRCGAELPRAAAFCPACGAAVQVGRTHYRESNDRGVVRVMIVTVIVLLIAAFGYYLAFPYHATADAVGFGESLTLLNALSLRGRTMATRESRILPTASYGRELEIEPAPSKMGRSVTYYYLARRQVGAPLDYRKRSIEEGRKISCAAKARDRVRNFGIVAALVLGAAILVWVLNLTRVRRTVA